jgi:phenylpropionate dioxygenase-like ring-hydroxylating dioxygenase large terminal subunit
VTTPGVYADLHAQRSCWHPVAHGHALGDAPSHADLLDEPLVLWRGPDREPHAMSELCVHRGTALSLGWVSGDQIVCPYHGRRYAADGRCVAIPQLEDPARVPARARVPAFRVQERYGLIWVALEEPRWPLPEVPELSRSPTVRRCGRTAWLRGRWVCVRPELPERNCPAEAPGLPERTSRPGPHWVRHVLGYARRRSARPRR